jgi:hypothetical protein
MEDFRWLRLQDTLLNRGWSWHDDALYAPHDTLWFSRKSGDASLAVFGEHMRQAAQASAEYIDVDPEHAQLHHDLVSLVEAIDEVLEVPVEPALMN